jgi:hypothetical protein
LIGAPSAAMAGTGARPDASDRQSAKATSMGRMGGSGGLDTRSRHFPPEWFIFGKCLSLNNRRQKS